uniref:Uncharacterized protein n=1 Tax=Cannabis sativa TaxID=3483 RepID=A0A803QG29_CANSA
MPPMPEDEGHVQDCESSSSPSRERPPVRSIHVHEVFQESKTLCVQLADSLRHNRELQEQTQTHRDQPPGPRNPSPPRRRRERPRKEDAPMNNQTRRGITNLYQMLEPMQDMHKKPMYHYMEVVIKFMGPKLFLLTVRIITWVEKKGEANLLHFEHHRHL